MSAHRSQSARIDLTLPSLAGLQTRRSEKWVGHDPDVISSTIAEMDFPVAEPIIRALHAAIDRHDLGYAPATIPTLAEAFAGFAARRLGWRVDPGQITLLPDVMVGVLELARLLAGPNRSVACPVPAYPPFLIELPAAGLSVHPISLTASRAIDLMPWPPSSPPGPASSSSPTPTTRLDTSSPAPNSNNSPSSLLPTTPG